MESRLGVQDGDETKAFSKTTPSRAMRSSVGVLITGSPRNPACGTDQSSAMRKRMFGESVFPAEFERRTCVSLALDTVTTSRKPFDPSIKKRCPTVVLIVWRSPGAKVPDFLRSPFSGSQKISRVCRPLFTIVS